MDVFAVVKVKTTWSKEKAPWRKNMMVKALEGECRKVDQTKEKLNLKSSLTYFNKACVDSTISYAGQENHFLR